MAIDFRSTHGDLWQWCREQGFAGDPGRRLRVYVSAETHTWIQKTADLGGLGTAAIRWIPTDASLRMDVAALRRQIDADAAAGETPCVVVGTAGSVSTGAVDPLRDIGALCREYGIWFHVDGAYGGSRNPAFLSISWSTCTTTVSP